MNKKRSVIIGLVILLAVVVVAIPVGISVYNKNKEPELYRLITGEYIKGTPVICTPVEWVEPTPASYGEEAVDNPTHAPVEEPEASEVASSEGIKESLEETIQSCKANFSGGEISKIYGVIKNEAYKNQQGEKVEESWSHVRLEFDLYNSNGEFIRTISAYKDGLSVGQVWYFETNDCYGNQATTFKLNTVSRW